MEPEKDMFEQWAEEREANPWYKKIANRISLNWEFKYQYLWRDFKTGVKNIIYWLPIIWKDRNWDYHYIYTILQHKLKSQSKYIGDRVYSLIVENRHGGINEHGVPEEALQRMEDRFVTRLR